VSKILELFAKIYQTVANAVQLIANEKVINHLLFFDRDRTSSPGKIIELPLRPLPQRMGSDDSPTGLTFTLWKINFRHQYLVQYPSNKLLFFNNPKKFVKIFPAALKKFLC
jgi:hypothetical protein